MKEVISQIAGIQVGGYIEGHGVELFRLAKEKGLEGIIAKWKTSIYRPGKRSSDWLKIKARLQQEFFVGGFTGEIIYNRFSALADVFRLRNVF